MVGAAGFEPTTPSPPVKVEHCYLGWWEELEHEIQNRSDNQGKHLAGVWHNGIVFVLRLRRLDGRASMGLKIWPDRAAASSRCVLDLQKLTRLFSYSISAVSWSKHRM